MTEAARSSRPMRITIVIVGLLIGAYAVSDHPLYGGEPGFGGTQKFILAAGVFVALFAFAPVVWGKRILALTLSCLLTLALAETAGEFVLSPKVRAPYVLDEELLFKLWPDRYSVFQRLPVNGGESIVHRINTHGFRGEEQDDAGPRVMVYGDSFIHAAYSPLEETFVVRLDAELERRLGTEVDTINAGVSSYGPDQILLKLRRELPEYRPDLVVVTIFAGNDYGDLLRNKLFKVSEDGSIVPNSKTSISQTLRTNFEINRCESVLKRAIRQATRKPESVLDSLEGDDPGIALMNSWLETARQEYQEYVVDGNDEVNNMQADYYSADLSLEPASESALYKVRFMTAVLTEIHELVSQAGIEVLFVAIPHPIDVVETYECCGKVDRERFPDYDRRNLTAPIAKLCKDSAYHCVDLFDTFEKVDASELFFVGGDDHWNARGQALAAEVVGEKVMDGTLLVRDGLRSEGPKD